MKTTERNFARRLDLTSLQLFVAVCELGSIGKAAEREFIAASAVSKRLADLETAVDTQLLYRHSRGVTLTPAGESLLHHARAVLFGLEKMQGELSEYAKGVRGHVRVHANISAIVQFLPEDLGAFARAQPEVKIDLEEHLSHQVIHAVREGAADIGICHAPAEGHGDDALPSRPQVCLGLVSYRDRGDEYFIRRWDLSHSVAGFQQVLHRNDSHGFPPCFSTAGVEFLPANP